MRRVFAFTCYVLAFSQTCQAQNQPHVDQLIESLDIDKDGSLSKDEAAKNARYARQFSRWDADGDGKVSKKEIVKYRAKFGITADGSSLRPTRDSSAKPFTIPDVESLRRVGKGTRVNRAVASNSQFILKTEPHPTIGESYVVLTDHHESDYLSSVERLATHHQAKTIRVDDLAVLHQNGEKFDSIREQLKAAKFVAIVPRHESFRENMVLSMWQLLSTLDDDPQLDCFPGFLVASNPESFGQLVDQSIQHKPLSKTELKPMAINQVQNSRETRSLQKSGILRNHFQKVNLDTPIVAIYGQQADAAPRLKGDQTWNLQVAAKQQFVKSFSDPINKAIAKSNLVVMHGHGIPGMSCSMDIDAIPKNFRGKVLLSGSCFSASPIKSDLASMRQAPGGYSVKPRDAFIVRAIDNGAIVAFGHQRLSSGFPHLYPVLETWLEGKTVGQAYQQLINGLIDLKGTESGDFILTKKQKSERSPSQQRFLYVVIGDPALQPFENLSFGDKVSAR